MKCTPFELEGGGRGFICGSTRGAKVKLPRCGVEGCAHFGTRLCDWKLGGGKTCDLPVCTDHTTTPAPNKDLCPAHAAAWADMQKQQALPL